MSSAHPETMKIQWRSGHFEARTRIPFSLAKTLRRQEFTGLAPLRPSRLCKEEFPSKW
jgi:hypothetical protein